MGPGARIHRPKDPDRLSRSVKKFFIVARVTRRLHESLWVDRDAVLQAQAAPTDREYSESSTAKVSSPCTTQQLLPPRRDHGVLYPSIRSVLIPRSEDCRPLHLRAVRSVARNCGTVC
jgi:hypothetical protein